jgi:DNA-3-methyladenine glycosylase II
MIRANVGMQMKRARVPTRVNSAERHETKRPRQRTVDTLTQHWTEDLIDQGFKHLMEKDAKIAALLSESSVPYNSSRQAALQSLLPDTSACPFTSLCRSICYQQLHTKAAATIYARFLEVCAETGTSQLTPEAIVKTSSEDLRAAGLSQSKVSYVKDLSEFFLSGSIDTSSIRSMGIDELGRDHLLKVKGIGPWTVDMFGIFFVGLTDVVPLSDLGIKKGIQKTYGLKKIPTKKEIEEISEHWKPFRSLGSWLMWRSLES